jgi:GcrA cell cycle regulator
MWTDGLVASLISQRFHEKYGEGPTRSAILGKVHRLGDLQPRTRAHGHVKSTNRKERSDKGTGKPRGPNKPRSTYRFIFERPAPRPVVDSPALPGSSPGLLMSLKPHHCRWPVDGCGATMLYCRDPAHEGFPYCLAHCRLAYRPAERRQAA